MRLQSLQSYHTFGFDASCTEIKTIESLDGLTNSLALLTDKPFIVLGEGSNTVFIEDYVGTVLLNRLKGITVFEDDNFYHLNVASGENWHQLVLFCLERSIHGLENLALIPGTVGAAPIQNIGAYGVEIKEFIHSVEFVDVKSKRIGYFNNKECQFAYRDSVFKRDRTAERIIISVNFAIPKDNVVVTSYGPLAKLKKTSPKDIFETVVKTRQEKLPDPAEYGNAGSFFKNPIITLAQYFELQREYLNIPHYPSEDGKVKVPAAWLIDTLGFKGKKIGGIQCHEKQALVLLNLSDGKGHELLSLAREIRQSVLDRFDIQLENEVRLIGRNGLVSL
ncbi:UDP-N-acetylmuramate dehydrogenase [Agaribacter flavus]|uniref:UDP-N-acetylenolpyruvoylglucosamine reductase n=1 Tax=Agaribacter flavus TaxID=1902781 RepID=A0ABV7FVT4_9ALTE